VAVKLRSVVNGGEVEVSEDFAATLTASGLWEQVKATKPRTAKPEPAEGE